MVVHFANESNAPISLKDCRLWLPESRPSFRSLRPGPFLDITPLTADRSIVEARWPRPTCFTSAITHSVTHGQVRVWRFHDGLSSRPHDARSLRPRRRLVVRVDADGVHDVEWKKTEHGVAITDQVKVVALYLGSLVPMLKKEIAGRHRDRTARAASPGSTRLTRPRNWTLRAACSSLPLLGSSPEISREVTPWGPLDRSDTMRAGRVTTVVRACGTSDERTRPECS
jgi:hypothetical protein